MGPAQPKPLSYHEKSILRMEMTEERNVWNLPTLRHVAE